MGIKIFSGELKAHSLRTKFVVDEFPERAMETYFLAAADNEK